MVTNLRCIGLTVGSGHHAARAQKELLVVAEEFRWLPDVAARVGVHGPLPEVVRVTHRVADRAVSALRMGDGEANVCFLHGGGQNAHTWDAVALSARIPSISVDLPGHGHSEWRADRDYRPERNARGVASLLDAVGVRPRVVVGMSLGGLTALHLASARPDLAQSLILVDVTPNAGIRVAAMNSRDRGAVALLGGPQEFSSFDEMLASVRRVSPGREPESLRQAVWHNASQGEDRMWRWRSHLHAGHAWRPRDHSASWGVVPGLRQQVTLAVARDSEVVSAADVEEFRRHCSGLRVVHFPTSAHSIQGAMPVELAHLVADVHASLVQVAST